MPEKHNPISGYHVVGAAGVGMSAVAELLARLGHRVSGSDRALDQGQAPDVLNRLRAGGVRLVPQSGEGVTSTTTAIVVSTAIEPSNPDLLRARALDVPIIHRARMLAELARGKQVVAITGTAGKTTVTGMVGWMLECLGRDPTVVNGGALLDWQGPDRVGNVRVGTGDLWVIEADESDRSLLAFEPAWAAITNASKDHFELNEVTDLFARFSRSVENRVLAGSDVRRRLPDENFEAFVGTVRRSGGRWQVEVDGRTLAAPGMGRHNAENARAAVSLCLRLGCDLDALRDALSTFRGIERRLERAGEHNGVTVIDDYAHNPVKIAAAWSAVSEGAERVLGVWRPHGFAPLELLREDLAASFASVCRPGDRLYLLPVYYAGGTTSGGVTSADLAEDLARRGVAATVCADYDALGAALFSEARPGDAVLVMGARDPGLPRFAHGFAHRLARTVQARRSGHG